MIQTKKQIYLASKSPRRKKLLKQIGINYKSFTVETAEEFLPNESPIKTAKRIALEKLKAAEKKVNSGIIITADTIVVLDGKIIGKPRNKKEAFQILSDLSGNTHNVYTGFAIKDIDNGRVIIDYEKTAVTFQKLSDKEIKEYIDTGSPMDKAGAYGIQDEFGSVFIKKINGCYHNVIGLPLSKFYKSLKEIVDVC